MSRHQKYNRWIPLKTRKLILERDGHCQICGSTSDLCVSRKIPGSKGGLPVEDNLQVLCRTCVAIKQNYILSNDDLRMYLARYETMWQEPENDKHKILWVNSLIRYDLWEQERSKQNIERTNDQDMEGTKEDVLHSLRERHKLFLERKGCA